MLYITHGEFIKILINKLVYNSHLPVPHPLLWDYVKLLMFDIFRVISFCPKMFLF